MCFKQHSEGQICCKDYRRLFVRIDTPNKCDFRLDKFGAKTTSSLVVGIDTPNKCDFIQGCNDTLYAHLEHNKGFLII